MSESVRQQLIISGVGGQGVLFVTRLLAEAAIIRGLPVFTSETHGMAQRGGTVLSHLKVGDFSSPLIRPMQADGLLVLKAENLAQHGSFLKSGGWAIVNADNHRKPDAGHSVDTIDADALARKIENPKAVNLIILGFALARVERAARGSGNLYCAADEIKSVLKNRFGKKEDMLTASLKALEAGYNADER
jgi:indolepyruvate ferredoxin oxidoreductase beta subunit